MRFGFHLTMQLGLQVIGKYRSDNNGDISRLMIRVKGLC
jgi:hypothetical protein